MITASNYKSEINRIGLTTMTNEFQKSNEFFIRATSDFTDLHRIENPGPIKKTWDIYLQQLNASISSKKIEDKYDITYLTPKEKAEPKPQAAAPVVKVKAKRAPRVKAAPKPKAEPRVKAVPKVKVTPAPKEKPAPAPDTHVYSVAIPIEVRFIKSYLSMDGRQKTRTQLLGFLARLQKAITELQIRATSKFATEIRHIQSEMIAVINSLKNETPFTFELDKKDQKVLDQNWKEQFTDKYRVNMAILIIKRYINLQGKTGVKDKANVLDKFIDHAYKTGKIGRLDYEMEMLSIKLSLRRYLDGDSDSLGIDKKQLNGLLGIAGIKKKSNLSGVIDAEVDYDKEATTLGFVPELAANVVASFLYDKVAHPANTPENTPDIPPVASDQDALPVGNSNIIRSDQLKHMRFIALGLTGEWKTMLGDVANPFAMMVYGKPGSGKSTFNLLFAKYLSQVLNKKVLIVSGEEGFSATMKEKFERLQVYGPNVFLSDGMPASFDGYDVAFIDSINHLGLNEKDLNNMLAVNLPKNVSFIFVFHSTKDGNYRGVATFEHLVDISMKVDQGITTMGKNRFGGQGSMQVY